MTFGEYVAALENGLRTSLGIYPPQYGVGQYPPLYFASIAADHAGKLEKHDCKCKGKGKCQCDGMKSSKKKKKSKRRR